MDGHEERTRSLAGSPETARDDSKRISSHAPKGHVAIVFSDIKDSTALWEELPAAMQESIRIHDDILRSNSRQFDGYEVKAIGDAFMVAFSSAKSALQFCLRVQTDLIAADWPAPVLDSKYGKQERDKDYNLIHRGLSVRMAIHWGEPICEMNRVTNRMDYIGPMVHRVSRAMEVADGGQIVVTENFLNELEGAARNLAKAPRVHPKGLGMGLNGEELEDGLPLPRSRDPSPNPGSTSDPMPRQQAFAMKDTGKHELKGLTSPLHLHMMVPASLSGRLLQKPPAEEAATGLQGWFQWTREGIASNASVQNILPI